MSPGRGLPRLQAGALRALAVGHSTLDRYGDDLLPGGSAWYGARVFSALGADVSLHTAHGPGGDSNAFDGLAVTRTPSEHWTVFTNRHDSQGRRTQHVETEASPIPPPASPPRPTPDVLFLAPVFGELSLSAWVEAVPAPLVGMGCQGWLKCRVPAQSDAGPSLVVPSRWPWSDADLGRVHVACLSIDDVGGDSEILNRLIRIVPLVALTLGARGCLLFERGRGTHVPAASASEVDPTGAGDTFAAALLMGLAEKRTPLDAARRAAVCAARVVEAQAGLALPSLGAMARG